MVLGVFLIGANLRLPITMMPPLLNTLSASGILPKSLAGFVTSIPLAMFAIMSPVIGKLGAKYGPGRVLTFAASALVLGAGLRLIPNAWGLLIGTAFAGLGITGGNVLLPALIKSEFPHRIAVMTTMYTTAMGLGRQRWDWDQWAVGQTSGTDDYDGDFWCSQCDRLSGLAWRVATTAKPSNR
jgi:CP family cyanate transporter-like MFS transporter